MQPFVAVTVLVALLGAVAPGDPVAILDRADAEASRLPAAVRRSLSRDLAIARQLIGDPTGAAERFRALLLDASDLDDLEELTGVLGRLGSEELVREAVRRAEVVSADQEDQAATLASLGMIQAAAGDFEAARKLVRASVPRRQGPKGEGLLARLKAESAWVESRLRAIDDRELLQALRRRATDPARAAALLDAARTKASRQLDPVDRTGRLAELVGIQLRAEDYAGARQAAAAIPDLGPNVEADRARAPLSVAEAFELAGDRDTAAAVLRQATPALVRYARVGGERRNSDSGPLGLGIAILARSGARDEALALVDSLSNPGVKAVALAEIALAAALAGDRVSAGSLFRRADEAAEGDRSAATPITARRAAAGLLPAGDPLSLAPGDGPERDRWLAEVAPRLAARGEDVAPLVAAIGSEPRRAQVIRSVTFEMARAGRVEAALKLAVDQSAPRVRAEGLQGAVQGLVSQPSP